MTATADLIDDLGAFGPRPACSDTERRAALFLHDELRGSGEQAWVETVWTRPGWAGSLFWHALAGVVASLVATAVPVAGLVLASVALASWAWGLTGRDPLLDRLTRARRATQLVLVEPPDPDARVTVWLHAATDTPRRGLGLRLARGRAAGRLAALGLGLVTAATAARVAGLGTGLELAQFIPTLLLLAVAGAAIDAVLSDAGPGTPEAGAVAATLAAFDALRADPPPGVSPGLLLGGAASETAPLALRAWLRAGRPDPAGTLLVLVGPTGGDVAWSARQPQLRAAFGRVTGAAPGRAGGGRGLPLARRWPQVVVGGGTPAALAATVVTGLGGLELQPPRAAANATNQS